METLYDGLVFDFRKPEDLFDNKSLRKVHYADLIKRWAEGDKISEKEQTTLARILVYYPEYVLNHDKDQEFVGYLRKIMQNPEIQRRNNPEKGIYLYSLVCLLLKTGDLKQIYNELSSIIKLIHEYVIEDVIIFIDYHLDLPLIERLTADAAEVTSEEERIAQIYIRLISNILDSKDFIELGSVYTLMNFPVPHVYIENKICQDIRSLALQFYNNQMYKKALKYYQILRIVRFDPPGTMTHFVRVQLMLGNVSQAEIYTAMAWDIRSNAVPYVKVRILFLIIFLNLIQSKPVDIWLACLKHALMNLNEYVYWQMEEVLRKYEQKLNADDFEFLLCLSENLVNFNYINESQRSEIRMEIKELEEKDWPDQLSIIQFKTR